MNLKPIELERVVKVETCIESEGFHCSVLNNHQVHCEECHAWWEAFKDGNQGPVRLSPGSGALRGMWSASQRPRL